MPQTEDLIPKPHVLLRTIRREPHLYGLLSKAVIFYSRNIVGAAQKKAFEQERTRFLMNPVEARHCDELKRTGFTVLNGLFDAGLMDQIYERADYLFKNLRLDFKSGYSVANRSRSSLEGLTYAALESTEKVIYLEEPLRNIRECLPIVFNETILKIVTKFFRVHTPAFCGRDRARLPAQPAPRSE